MSAGPAPDITAFALAVIQHPEDATFCLVHEKKNRGWWLPGGGVDAGETFAEAALREVREEAGIDCELTGVLRVDFGRPEACRMRVIFFARPTDPSTPLKSVPDEHSRSARWFTLEELDALAFDKGPAAAGVAATPECCWLRGPEPYEWFHYVAAGGTVFSLDSLLMTRLGPVDEDAEEDNGGSPRTPRRKTHCPSEHAFYPTACSVALACARNGEVLVTQDQLLPEAALPINAEPERFAADFAQRSGLGRLAGLSCVRHTLDVRSDNDRDHTASLQFVYAVEPGADAKLPAGLAWAPAADAAAQLPLAASAFSMVAPEGKSPSIPGVAVKKLANV